MSTKNLTFHLLDLYAHDQRIEHETNDAREVVYESDGASDDEVQRKTKDSSQRREFIIHLFGETADGTSVRADITGFRPWFYLRLPEERTAEAVDAIRRYIASSKIPIAEIVMKRVNHESFFGFTARTQFPFLYIDFPSLAMWRNAKALFLNSKSIPEIKQGHSLGAPFRPGQAPEVFEANIDPMLRFLHVQNIQPCGWVTIEDGMESVELDNGIMTLTCNSQCVDPCAAPPRACAPFLIASWDIECYSATGDFPIAKKNGEWRKVGKAIRGLDISGVQDTLNNLLQNGTISILGKAKTTKNLNAYTKYIASPAFAVAVATANLTTDDLASQFAKGCLERYVEPCGDPVIQIGVTLTRDYKSFDRHLFVWPSCAPCEGIEVHCAVDERTMINDFFEWIVKANPDILIGYNVFGFDEKYLWERAEELKYITDGAAVHGLNRLRELGLEVKLEEKFLSSSALGDNFLYMWSTQGRLQVDLYHYIRRSTSLPSYKLDEVTKNYMSGKLKSYRIEGAELILEVAGAIKDIRAGRAICLLDAIGESITDKLVVLSVADGTIKVACPTDPDTVRDIVDAQKWVVVKDDVSPQDIFRLHRGSAEDRATVGRYCLQDCDLVLELYKKLEVFNNAMSMANVCSVPISYIFVRGQGIKAESLIFKACRERGVLIPVLPAPRQKGDGSPEEDSYEGAIVLDPVPGFYSKSPIGVADFASLYPSTIESENISHDSLVWVKDFNYDGSLIVNVFGNEDYDECEGYGYTDIEFDIWRPDPADTRKHPVKVKVGRRICRYAQPLDGSKATLPEIIRSLLAARKAKRKEAEKEKDPERAALLDAEQLAYKLTGNSLYGQLGSGTFKVRLQHLAASVTGYGRKQILFAKAIIEKFYGSESIHKAQLGGTVVCAAKCDAKVVYGDSVTGDTALPISINGIVQTTRIDELISDMEWTTWHDTKESIDLTSLDISVWSDRGFTQIKRIIRHKLHPSKKLYRINTDAGIVDVTEDHSLVLLNGQEVAPADVHNGTELLHNSNIHEQITNNASSITIDDAFVMGLFLANNSVGIIDTSLFYNEHGEKRIPSELINAPLAIVRPFWDGFCIGYKDLDGTIRFNQTGKEFGTGLTIIAYRLGYSVSIDDRIDNTFNYTMTINGLSSNAITNMYELQHPGADTYVYDLETDNHHFAVGPGALIVHNTDSLFVEFNPHDAITGERLTGCAARQATIDLTAEAGHLVSQALKPPHDFEFDKVFDPMLIFSKKRYAGLMFENNANDYVHKYMGIALKRRDNAPIVKTIFGGAMKKLLLERDVIGATHLVKQLCSDLINGKVSLNQLTITKSLRADYVDPKRIAHKALADRITVRDPGNAPASGDRIGFVYIRPKTGQVEAKLQGDRIESPAYVRDNKLALDYRFYIEHQIQNPVSQMFGIVLEDMPGFDTRMLDIAPTDTDKCIAWREQRASDLLFGEVLRKCGADDKKQFINTFFGGGTFMPPTANVTVTSGAGKVLKTIHAPVKRAVQTPISSYIMDTFIVSTINKKEKEKVKEKEKREEKKEEKEKESKKNIPCIKPI
jgi:DNA polymerase elongation subunit (family B)